MILKLTFYECFKKSQNKFRARVASAPREQPTPHAPTYRRRRSRGTRPTHATGPACPRPQPPLVHHPPPVRAALPLPSPPLLPLNPWEPAVGANAAMAHARVHKRQRKLGEEALSFASSAWPLRSGFGGSSLKLFSKPCLIGKAEKYFLKLFRIPTKHAVNDE